MKSRSNDLMVGQPNAQNAQLNEMIKCFDGQVNQMKSQSNALMVGSAK
jgi:hypothetical protein